MSKSYRIRTKVGVDTSLKVLIDQEFEYLEILSLKILQSDIYTRQCADYGVVVGRVSVNNGFGIPNAKVSIFIPLDNVDENDPVISNIYPYKNLYDVNDDGYRYNLLPYKPSYSAHIPTGTFFTRRDVLLSPVLGDIYDKYYKYNAVTNDSGDYMIFGVPVGSHTIVVDIDLSDIGEFSLSPQDLIRMGRATENQVDGTKFRSSTNLGSLPQIVSFKRTIEIEPLWGQPEICNLGITRTDFDLTGEANVDIRPTAIFMGSMVSDTDSNAIRRNCKPSRDSGNLCNLITGPGEILAIRQTIQQDVNGRPILESYGLEGGGTIIDAQGTWLVDVPMNLDYYITNEFGEQVLSTDPTKGIPTKGKYRFKVKWTQSPSTSASTKRAHYLVPNIKDWGTQKQESYAFSLDWDDYGDSSNPDMIQEAIDCKDRFYLMQYNKVYTVSQYIDEWRNGTYQRFTGIKNILDETCESENNRYPTNDGFFRFDFFYVLFSFISLILTPVFYALILLLHIVFFIIWILRIAFFPLLMVYFGLLAGQSFAGAFSAGFGATFSAGVFAMGFVWLAAVILCGYILKLLWKIKLTGVSVPMLTYPDCSMCSCDQGGVVNENPDEDNGLKELTTDSGNKEIVPCSYIIGDSLPSSQLSLSSPILQLSTFSPFKVSKTGYTTYDSIVYGPYNLSSSARRLMIQTQFTGKQYDGESANPGYGVPSPYLEQDGTSAYTWTTTSLPIADRINLFNVKAKYFDGGTSNPGGGVNRISVKYEPTINTASNQIHYDNTIVILCDKVSLKKYVSGQMIAFQNPSFSKDPNINSPILNRAGNYAITGVTFTGNTTVTVPYSKFDGTGNEVGPTYNVKLTGNTRYDYIYRFPTDVEYFQVITGMTYNAFTGMCNTQLPGSLNERYIGNISTFWPMDRTNDIGLMYSPLVLKATDSIKDKDLFGVIILNRGVDPYTDKIEIEYGLGRLFGFNDPNAKTIKTKCRMNIPIQGKFLNTSHSTSDYQQITLNGITAGNALNIDTYSGNKLYYDSFSFTPQPLDISGNTIQYQEDMTTAYTWTFLSAGYSGYNSNLISYYSKLDNRSVNFELQCDNSTYTVSKPNPSITIAGKSVPARGFSVKSQNRFSRELYVSTFRDRCGYSVNRLEFTNYYLNNGKAQGYMVDEIVEGSAIMDFSGYVDYRYASRCPGTFSSSAFHDAENPVDTLIPFYWSPTYDSTGNTLNFGTGTSGKQIVMRGDRLPTSTVLEEFCCNSWVLQKNANLQVYLIPDNGVVGISSTAGSTGMRGSGAGADVKDDLKGQKKINGLFQTFTCEGSVNLDCYDQECTDINGAKNGVVKINDREKRGLFGILKFDKGCYKFITVMFLSLLQDWEMMAEWIARNMVMLGACRNVFSHSFNNNWVNGNLYVMSFKNDTIGFSSPTAIPPNAPILRYCDNVVIKHTESSNFYYRCSKYDGAVGKFIDQIKYPTTMMDLGPRSSFIQELVMSDEYDGYVINKLNTSSFSQVDEILNLYIISRFLDNDFRKNLIGSLNVLAYFIQSGEDRGNLKFDGDYSQLISISSELGISSFQSTNYPDSTDPLKQSPIFIGCDGTIGIFFSSDTQIRDYISPKRTIIDPKGSINNQSCSFNNFPVYSQEVPLSQWIIKPKNAPSIFGGETNTWADNDYGIFTSKYQSLDRLNNDSRYFRNNGVTVSDDKGYIYGVDGNGDLIAATNAWSRNAAPEDISQSQMVTVGAPFHFYFGLKRGASSFDRFRSKWVETENIVN